MAPDNTLESNHQILKEDFVMKNKMITVLTRKTKKVYVAAMITLIRRKMNGYQKFKSCRDAYSKMAKKGYLYILCVFDIKGSGRIYSRIKFS